MDWSKLKVPQERAAEKVLVIRHLQQHSYSPQESLDPGKIMASAPTLGCQFAPSYNHETWPYNSDSSSDDESENGSVAQEQVAEGEADIEKAETARDADLVRPSALTPRQSGRLRSDLNISRKESRKSPQQDPVGFWHWQMVRTAFEPEFRKLTHTLGRR
jgi:hypothetical protein